MFDAYRQFYRAPSDLELARRFLLERFRHSESVIFIAELPGGAPAGFTQLYPSFSSLSAAQILVLNDLYVQPEARRMKVASVLMDAAIAYGRTIGAVRLTLSTEVSNIAAQALYETSGWSKQTDFLTYNLPL
ncbi:MAG TPA: GNAT family N-acetyltransferase [Bryobacteraceae bacterium]|nr:GNAT family N-acetyltransferase [Bryobacteraceae bacterium]